GWIRKDRPAVAAAPKLDISGRPPPVATRGGGLRGNGLDVPGTPVTTFPLRLLISNPIWLPKSREKDLFAWSNRASISTCCCGVSRNFTIDSRFVNCEGS